MRGLLAIAFRNVIADRKRTALMGLSLLLSCLFLLLTDAIGNGAGTQLLRRHRDMQSGDVAVVWKNVLEDVDPSDPGRILFSEFDAGNDVENRAAISMMDEFLAEHTREISSVYRTVRAFGTLDTGTFAAYCMIDGVSAAELAHLEKTRTLELVDGSPLLDLEYGVYLSQEMADKYGIWTGDYISLDCATPSGLVNSLDFEVAGVYRDGAPWDNITVFLREEDARTLLEWDAGFLSSARITLKDPGTRGDFARLLDARLVQAGGALRAEASDVSTRFWSAFSGFLKTAVAFFTVFLLLVIAVGIRSTIRMNLFQRIREFGTLRAMGFSRLKCVVLVFAETFLISIMALAAAAVMASLAIPLFGRTGLYVGPGPASYVLGSQYVYPVFMPVDLAMALAIVTCFALAAPLAPGLKLCLQAITDLLARNQKRVSILTGLFAGLFTGLFARRGRLSQGGDE